jgi:hypothetical protein
MAATSNGEALAGLAGAQRRQCGGATCNYLGNGSEADMDGLADFKSCRQISPAQAVEKSAEVILVGKRSGGAMPA